MIELKSKPTQPCLRKCPGLNGACGDLDGEYRDIIRRAYGQDDVVRRCYFKVMSVHLVTDKNGKIDIDCLAFMANANVDDAENVLRPLGPVLDVDEGLLSRIFQRVRAGGPRRGIPQ